MSTDRALLEAAAKAAGIEGEYDCWTGMGFAEGIRQVLNGAKCARPWNPLTDDGDALRLAVRLRIDIEFEGWVTFAGGCFSELNRDDPAAATRRAIVKAAAAIGARRE